MPDTESASLAWEVLSRASHLGRTGSRLVCACYELTVAASSLGQALFAVGRLLLIRIAESLNELFRNQI